LPFILETKAVRKRSILLVWGVALALTLLQAAVWQISTPPWTAPDEPGHYLFVRLYAETGHPPRQADMTTAHWQAILASLKQTGWQQYISPHAAQTALAQNPILRASGLQVGRKPPGYYALAAFWLQLSPHWRQRPPVAHLRWLRLLSALLHLTMTAAVLFLATRLWPDRSDRILGLGMLAGLLPMVGFIGNSLNNDALTMLWGALAFAALVLARRPGGWLLAMALILLGPLLVDVNLLFLWPLLPIRWAFFVYSDQHLRLRSKAAIRKALLPAALLVLFSGILLLPNPRRAAGWRWRNAAQTRKAGQLFLSAPAAPPQLSQTLSGKGILQRQGQALTLTARVSGQGGPLVLQLDDGGHRSEARCPLTPKPQICQLTLHLTPDSQHISVIINLPEGAASLQMRLTDGQGFSLLSNGDGRRPAPLGQPLFTWLERHLPLPAGYFSRLVTADIWDVSSLLRYGLFAGFTWLSFWGDFGWLSRPYPWPTFLFLAAATLAAIAGLGRRFIHFRKRAYSPENGILIFSLLAFLLILLQTWLPMLGQAWQPQGRYLFPALAPIAILLLLGWEALLSTRRRCWLPTLLLLTFLLLTLQAWRIIQP